MTDHKELEKVYKLNLENDIIQYIAGQLNVDLRRAMDMYYSSNLSEQIEAGICGIENLDFKLLGDDLIENELKKECQDARK